MNSRTVGIKICYSDHIKHSETHLCPPAQNLKKVLYVCSSDDYRESSGFGTMGLVCAKHIFFLNSLTYFTTMIVYLFSNSQVAEMHPIRACIYNHVTYMHG